MLNPMRLALAAVFIFTGCGTTREKRMSSAIKAEYGVRDPAFRESIGHLLGSRPVEGNHAVTLINGDQIFPAMLAGIRSAKRSVTFETFVLWDGEVAKQFFEALAERARAGVKVHVIIDAHGGNKAGRSNVRKLTEAGAEVEKYRRFMDPLGFFRYNNRTHRKLLVIDGRVGFIGGVGIADEWAGDSQSPEHWRDNHYRVEGPVVAQFQSIFAENWMKTRHQLLHGPDYFPPLKSAGSLSAQAFGGAPREGSLHMSLMYELSIAAARKNIRIANAYFVPDRRLMKALLAAAGRGVSIEIITPGEDIDQKMVRHAGRRAIKKLLKAGVKIYEFQGTMLHAKLLIVDDYFVSVGSANFDNRSLRLNDEANMNVFDAGFAARQRHNFELDKSRSTPVTPDFKSDDVVNKPAEVSSTAVSSQL